MKKLIPVIIVLSLGLSACSGFPLRGNDDPVTDAEMATRVAELLATMTTPTTEMDFPATPTPMPATPEPTAAPVEPTEVVATSEPVETTPEPTEAPEATEAAGTPAAEQPTATPTLQVPDTDPIKKLGTPTGVDPFDSYEKWTWPTDSDNYISVNFKDGYLQMTSLTNMAGWRVPMVSQQTNSYIELTVNSGACADKDSYGIILRIPVFKEPTQGYLYEVTCDGYLRL